MTSPFEPMPPGGRAAGPSPSRSPNCWRTSGAAASWPCVLLLLMTGLLYAPTLQFDFVRLDDEQYVVSNPYVQQGLTRDSLRWALTGEQLGNWHPLTSLSFVLNCAILGPGAGGFHAINVLLHLCNVMLLFGILCRMTGARWRSAAVAALFAWHPLHVESVAWIAERKDVLCGFFWFLTIGLYLRYVARPGWARYVLSLACFALGLLSKPMVVTLPFVLLLLDLWPLRRFDFGSSPGGSNRRTMVRLIWEKLPFFFLAAASCWITFSIQQNVGAMLSVTQLSLGERLANAVVAYGRYLGKALWPANLSVLCPFPDGWPWWQVAAAASLFASLSFFAFQTRRRAPYLLVGWLWFAGTLIPVIGLVQVGTQSMADRYVYLPLVGIYVSVAWGMNDWLRGRPNGRVIAVGVAGAALAGCLAVTKFQLRHWRDSEALFRRAIQVTRDNGLAHKYLGHVLRVRGKFDESLFHYTQAVQIMPYDAEAHFFRAFLLGALGRMEESAGSYLTALRLQPDYAEAHHNLANHYFARGQWQAAAAHYAAALRLQPGSEAAENNLATSLLMLGRNHDAMAHYREALRINPEYANAHCNLAILLSQQGSHRQAIGHFRSALRARPDMLPALDRLAWLLATSPDVQFRNGAEAVRLSERAVAASGGNDPVVLDTFAAACAEEGRFAEAVPVCRRALGMAAGRLGPDAISGMRRRLHLYEAGVPFREPPSGSIAQGP